MRIAANQYKDMTETHERPYDCDIHLDGPQAVQHAGKHRNTFYAKGLIPINEMLRLSVLFPQQFSLWPLGNVKDRPKPVHQRRNAMFSARWCTAFRRSLAIMRIAAISQIQLLFLVPYDLNQSSFGQDSEKKKF